jgi:UDP-N-acetylmuramoylalanine--D-glutamate ligase
VLAARRLARPVLGELELAWRLIPNQFIAVTGTNGKTTTTEWIGHIHRTAGLPVAVAGNVGTAASSLVG